LTVDASSRGYAVPQDFAGVSIFTRTQVEGHRGVAGNLFSGTNTQLITIFKNAGLHHVRLGATGASTSGGQNLVHADIDALFAFAKVTGIKVIYSLHGNGAALTAKYVWDNYRQFLDYFAFDNEPDGRASRDGGAYFEDWRTVSKSVLEAVPGTKFAGPDAAGRSLASNFLRHEKDCGCLSLITQHTYIGGNPIKRHIDEAQAINEILSEEWVTNKYPDLYDKAVAPVVKEGLPYRLTEFNDYVHGVTNVSDTFVTALWALDALHWWAAHGARGVNFQNTEWLRTDTFYIDAATNYQAHPKVCGIRAFDLGSKGQTTPVIVVNTNGLNLTAYAVVNQSNVCVTVINKEHGPTARDASVTIQTRNFGPAYSEVMFLAAPKGDITATNGVTLGGAPITNNAEWRGKWTSAHPAANGLHLVVVPAGSAAVVRIGLLL